MLKQSVLLTKPYYLSCKHAQLFLEPRNKEINQQTQHIPIEDIGIVLIDNREISLSATLMYELIAHNCVIVLCNDKHMPIGMTTAFDTHHLHSAITHLQINTSQPRKKQLWKKVVEHKIINQATLLKTLNLPYKHILGLSMQVKSGDSTHMEAQAAKKYWSELFFNISDFTRKREGEYPNNLLNYGYAILRASCARALVSSGLSCTLGIHHNNKYNAYCLVDDMMEPYRPFIDKIVFKMAHSSEAKELNTENKLQLVESMYQDVKIEHKVHPLINALTFTSASFVRSLEHGEESLKLPMFDE